MSNKLKISKFKRSVDYFQDHVLIFFLEMLSVISFYFKLQKV